MKQKWEQNQINDGNKMRSMKNGLIKIKGEETQINGTGQKAQR